MKKKQDPQAEDGAEAAARAADDQGELAQALADVTRERDEHAARWQRAQADFQNLRRRTQSDIEAAVRRSQQSLLEGLLLSIDQLELALSAARGEQQEGALARGVELTRESMLRTLSQAGVQPMDDARAGARFDPARHRAVASVPSEAHEPGSVVEVVRGGYAWGDQVLRPADVVVAAARGGEAEGA